MIVVKITAKEMNNIYSGTRGGNITGTHYALFEDGKGYCSLDGITPYILKGITGKNALQSIIDAGGFCEPISYLSTL